MTDSSREAWSEEDVVQQWAPDPYGRHELRWWDGQAWTEHVADAGARGVDPVAPVPPRHQDRSLGAQAGTVAHARVDGRRPARTGLGVGRHLLLTVLTCGVWLFLAPAWYLWRRGNRHAAGSWVAALGVLAVVVGVFGSDTSPPQPIGLATVPTEQVVPAPEARSTAPTTTPTKARAEATSKTATSKKATTKRSTTEKPTTKKPTTKKSTAAAETSTRRPRATATTSAKPKPKPTGESRQQGITPGAFCSPEGAFGVSKKGNLYVCRPKTPGDQARWLRV